MIGIVSYLFALFLVASIPFDLLFERWSDWTFQVNRRRESLGGLLVSSGALKNTILAMGLAFLKGYGLPLLTEQLFFYDEYLIYVSIVLVILAHLCSIYTLGAHRRHWLLVIWGALTYMYVPMSWVFPLILLAFALIFNSLHIAYLLSLVVIMVGVGLSSLPLLYLPCLIGVFVMVMVVEWDCLLEHFGGESWTLLRSFECRS